MHIQSVTNSMRMLMSTGYFRSWILEGTPSGARDRVTLLFGGQAKHLSYIRDTFLEDCSTRSLGRASVWKTRSLLEELDVDLAMIPAHTHSPFHHRSRDFFIPWRVSGVVDTSLDYSLPPWKRKLSDDFRKIRKYGYRYRVTSDPEEVETYHRTMYVPLIKSSHGDSASPMTLEHMLSELSRDGGELVLTLREDRPVAGEFVVLNGHRAISRAIGVLDGDRQLIREGAMSASSLNVIGYVRDKGFEELDFGSCRAFMSDGLTLNKKKWGFRITGYSPFGHILRILKPKRAIRSLLEQRPFIQIKNRKPWGTLFGPAAHFDPESARTRAEKTAIRGVAGMLVYAVDDTLDSVQAPALELPIDEPDQA